MKRLLLGFFALLPVLAGAQEAKEGDAAEAKEESYAGKIVEMRIGGKDMSDMRKFLEWEKVLKRVEAEKARAVVVRIDSTGGCPEATMKLMEQLGGLTVPSYGYVEGEVLGGAALVAVSTQTIYMAPGSLVGGGGLVRSDVEESPAERMTLTSRMLAKLRSVAAKHGRDLELVQALVAPSEEQKNFGSLIVPQGTLLTLTVEEALSGFDGRTPFAKGVAGSIEELLQKEGLSEVPVVEGAADGTITPNIVPPSERSGVSRPKAETKEGFGKAKEESFEGKVVVLDVGEHDLMNKQSFKFWRRMMRRAEDEGAAAVVFDLHTPGGLAFETQKLMTELTRIKVRTLAFVNPDALSAGALISVATDGIYVTPEARIGAAALVSAAGEIEATMRAKLHSAFEAHLRTVAEAKGYDAELIRAMMIMDDKKDRVFGEVVVPKGELLTLNAREAVSLRDGKPLLAKAIVSSIEEILALEGLEGVEIVRAEPTPFELFAWWAARFSIILILVGMGAAYAEMKAPGFGVGGAISLAAFGLFFFGNYMAGNLANYEMVALFVAGVLLIIVEIFLIPGTGLAGIAGVLCILGSLLFGTVDEIEWGDWKVGEFSGSLLDIMRGPVLTLGFGLIGGSILILILMRYLPNIPLFQFLVVHKELASGASITDGRTEGETRVGWTGETLTDLRPAGKAQFSDDELDVIADGTFIPKGAKVRIVEEDGMRVVVCEIEAT